jgi:alpha-1,3-rhamnosyl/mannosyltransferase
VKLIFAVDAIFPPLTGIGRYAWELANGLANSAEADDVKYYLHGRFVPNPTVVSGHEAKQGMTSTGSPPLSARIRARLAQSGAAVRVYSALTPHLHRFRLQRFDDHVFHSPNYFLPPFGGPALATLHDLSTLLYPEFHPGARVTYMNTELPKTLSRATHLVTVSEFIRAEVIKHLSWPEEKITAIGLGVDARFRPRDVQATATVLSTYGLTHGAYTLCVATVEPRKNIERLLEAHQALPEPLRLRYPLVLAGSAGWNSEDLHQRIKQLQGPGLHYLNYVPQDHLYALYAGARLFAFPSIYEGFGLPVLEAMASGTPVLISDRASLPEVAGGAAWQVNPLDVDDIRDGLTHALQDDSWRKQAVIAGLLRASEHSWKRCCEQTRHLYARFANSTSGGAR